MGRGLRWRTPCAAPPRQDPSIACVSLCWSSTARRNRCVCMPDPAKASAPSYMSCVISFATLSRRASYGCWSVLRAEQADARLEAAKQRAQVQRRAAAACAPGQDEGAGGTGAAGWPDMLWPPASQCYARTQASTPADLHWQACCWRPETSHSGPVDPNEDAVTCGCMSGVLACRDCTLRHACRGTLQPWPGRCDPRRSSCCSSALLCRACAWPRCCPRSAPPCAARLLSLRKVICCT